MAYDTGGGGGSAPSLTDPSRVTFDKPYDISSGVFNAETARQIDEMFRMLFQSLTKTEDKVDAIPTSSWSIVVKTVDESRTNDAGLGANVVAPDSELKFTLNANTLYRIRGRVFVDSPTGLGELVLQINGPPSPVSVAGRRQVMTSASAWNADQYDGAFDSSNQTSAHGSGVYIHMFDFAVRTAGAGTFVLKWCSASSSEAITVKQGSYFEHKAV